MIIHNIKFSWKDHVKILISSLIMTLLSVLSYEAFKPLGIIIIFGWFSVLTAVLSDIMRELVKEIELLRKRGNNIIDLLEWLKGQRYINIDECSTTMSEEFERSHRHELSTNIMINKTIKKIKEIVMGEI